jgi:hypothetical protein
MGRSRCWSLSSGSDSLDRAKATVSHLRLSICCLACALALVHSIACLVDYTHHDHPGRQQLQDQVLAPVQAFYRGEVHAKQFVRAGTASFERLLAQTIYDTVNRRLRNEPPFAWGS